MKKTFLKPALIIALLALGACSNGSSEESQQLLESIAPVAEESSNENEVAAAEGDVDQNLDQVFEELTEEEINNENVSQLAVSNYNHLDPKRLINTKALKEAVQYFEKNKSRIRNKNYITLIDFGKKSSTARFYIVNLKSGSVWAVRTSHGKGSDSNHDGYAEKFSDTSGSHASSLGYYLTAETYYGSNGYSLRLDGLSSTNSRARSRAVVIHGASYVTESSRIQGRSWGCPAIAMSHRTSLINTIKGGVLVYAFKK